MADIYDVKRRHALEFLRLPGVSGFGVERTSEGQYYLAVHLACDDASVRQQLPDSVEGFPLRPVNSGGFSRH